MIFRRNAVNQHLVFHDHPGLYSPTILKNVRGLFLQICLYLAAFECNTTSDWLNHTAFNFTKSWRERQRIFLRMVREYGPRFFFFFFSILSNTNSIVSALSRLSYAAAFKITNLKCHILQVFAR